MEFEELQEFLKDEKNKESFDTMVKAMGYETKDSIEGLKTKNYELLGKMKKIKLDKEEAQKVLDTIDIEGYNSYINNKDQSPKGDRELEKYKKLLEESQNKNQSIENNLNSVLKNSAISTALDSVNIDPAHKQILTSAFLGKASVETDGDSRIVTIDNDGLGLPTDEFFKQWVETDTGKTYLKKPENKGTNSSSFGSGNSSKIARSDFEKMSPQNQRETIKLVKDGSAQLID